jgi:methenyltetrahydrofolate cyclohydrolase
MLTNLTVSEFLHETASKSPAPGGGSAAAFAASLGAALLSMVCRLVIGRKNNSDVQNEMGSVLAKSEKLLGLCSAAIDEDTKAFNAVMAAFALPKETDELKMLRMAAVQEAMRYAAQVPLELMELCSEGIGLAGIIIEKGNQNSLSDAGVAVLMFKAACEGGALNVAVNLSALHDTAFVKRTKKEADNNLKLVCASADKLSRDIASRL